MPPRSRGEGTSTIGPPTLQVSAEGTSEEVDVREPGVTKPGVTDNY